MRSHKRNALIAALAAFALLLGGSSCNDLGDDPRIADAYVQITSITYTGTSLADAEDVVAHIKFDLNFRGDTIGDTAAVSKAQVQFDSGFFSANFPPLSGAILPNTVQFYCPSQDNEILLDVLPSGARVAGVTYAMSTHYDGRDITNGRPISFDANLAWSVTP
jgi:hypothetical protein